MILTFHGFEGFFFFFSEKDLGVLRFEKLQSLGTDCGSVRCVQNGRNHLKNEKAVVVLWRRRVAIRGHGMPGVSPVWLPPWVTRLLLYRVT